MIGRTGNPRNSLPDPVRHTMARLGTLERYQSGDVVVREGASSQSVFLIEDGEVEVTGRGAPPRAVGSGDVVGEEGFLGGRESATVVARGPTVARRIQAEELAAALAKSPELLHSVLDALRSVRQRRTERSDEATTYVAGLAEESLRHRAVRHPYLRALAEGTLPDPQWALRDFARHYYGYSRMFPRYLTTVLSKLDRAEHRVALLQNLTEESGTYDEDEIAELTALGIDRAWYDGVPHPQLFARFARAMGAELSETDEADELVCWRETFLDTLSRGSAAEAVGALGLGTENIVSTIYVSFVEALSRTDVPPSETVFFPLHTAVDDAHQAVLQAIAADLAQTPEGRRDLRRGMLKALQGRSALWDWLHERALARGEVEVADEHGKVTPEVVGLLEAARSREPMGERTAAGGGFVRSYRDQPQMYRNRHERLGIDFTVTRLGFEDLQTMDPRVVRIEPGATNELHRHAHESLFVVLEGEGEVRVGDDWTPLRAGEVAFVPRWIFHQTRNPSSDTPLVLLAITDFGFTSAALGDYDKRTRLAQGGDQAQETPGEQHADG